MNSFLLDVKRLARFLAGHAHWVVFGRIYIAASALLLSVVLSRSMPIDMYGKYQFYISTFFLAGSFSLISSYCFECIHALIIKIKMNLSVWVGV